MSSSPKRSVLVSGASIAGPALAHWLHRYGFEVTVVEKAPTVRGGGYPIDIRGTAVEVVEHMGLLPRLREAHIDSRKASFVDADGRPVGSVKPEDLTGGVAGRDIEVPRGELAFALYDSVRDDVEYVFEDSIATLHDHAAGVDVTFRSGTRRTFDLVVGADGIHSNTRSLAFGPEATYHRYLGHCFMGFTMPNDLGLSHEALLWNVPGKSATRYAVRDDDQVFAIMTFAAPEPPTGAFRDPAAQRDLVASAFAGYGWEIPPMVEAMRAADDIFFDAAGQIRMARWSSGRVALVGDAAHAPSLYSGQGSSISLVGAYVLAGELATAPDHRTAFAGYEERTRTFVETNQALAFQGLAAITPGTAEELAQRDEALRGDRDLEINDAGRAANSALDLPSYPVPTAS
ncbi:FAD-dependent monooxygenase [Streptomyces corynorhini]|uniref:FAD-dependent oxidoreductase n=1 Tax=Streptomyces corynorhini TaxID=2282652 RepID=A0A370B9U1_9ACTN|nr:FAD-dependent monooxygenase [Streptomyces corynorhini]RDG36205.1 FAD-dependent oxidoreductase [Streptomyces corynorhini]